MAASEAGSPRDGASIFFAEFELVPRQRRLVRNGVDVRIGGRALDILSVLVERPGEIVSRQELIERVWPGVHVGDSSLRVHVTELRKALGVQESGTSFIKNVAGRGYTFVGEMRSQGMRPPVRQAGPRSHGSKVYGREAVITEIMNLLAPSRIVTVHAIGGMGKTTVAREVAASLATRYAAGVFWVDMTAAANRDDAVAQIAGALGVTPASPDPLNEIASALTGKDILLVLDCCEPITETVCEIVDQLLDGASSISMLATSREILGARAEVVLALPPLTMPAARDDLTEVSASEFSAIEMFVERGAEAGGFALSDSNASTVARLCSALDGIPLALEIAAAQLATFGILDLELAIAERLRLGPNPSRRAEPRHVTLTDTLAWSYDLLSPREQTLLERLSVFEGAASLDAICSVVPDSEVPEEEILVDLTSLARKSLVKIERFGDRNGFRLLDTTRAFAAERLAQHGQERALRDRHALYMIDSALSSHIEGDLPVAIQWFGQKTPNLTNLRSALAWSFTKEASARQAVAIASAAAPLFMQLSLHAECERWASAAVDRIGDDVAFATERARLLAFRGGAMLGTKGPVDSSGRVMEEAVAAAEGLGDAGTVGLARSGLFWLYVYRGQPADAIAQARRLETSGGGSSDTSGDLIAANCIASAATYLGDHAESMRLLLEIERRQPVVDLGRFMRVGSDPGIFTRVFMIKTLWLLGRVDEAQRLYERILPNLRIPEHLLYLCYGLNEVVIPMFCQRRLWDEARAAAAELIDASSRQGMAIRRSSAESAAMAMDILQGEGDVLAFEGSLRLLRAAKMLSMMPWFDWVLAVGLARIGRTSEALRSLEGAIASASVSQNMWWSPELLRTKGELLAEELPGSVEAGLALREARALARRQSSLALEIRAAAACVTYCASDDEKTEALGCLKETIARTTEGLEDPDARAARDLLASGS